MLLISGKAGIDKTQPRVTYKIMRIETNKVLSIMSERHQYFGRYFRLTIGRGDIVSMVQQNSLIVSDLATDEQVVSYLLDIRTRTCIFVLGILEAIDMLQEARTNVQELLTATRESNRDYPNNTAHLSTIESMADWNSKITTADTKLLIAAQSMPGLREVVQSFAGDNCSRKIRRAVQDVAASQNQLENKLHFSRSLLAELNRLKGELLAEASTLH